MDNVLLVVDGEVVQYEDTCRLAYVRGSEGIVGLNEQLKEFDANIAI